jgi:tRNA (guanine37-N1)-methyltransferase
MKCEPIFEAVEDLKARPGTPTDDAHPNSPATAVTPTENSEPSTAHFSKSRVILMAPAGRRFDQKLAAQYAQPGAHLIVLCGHYEGVDQRVIDHLADDEISIGDYVLTNGALAAAVFVDAVVRLLPGVLGHENSAPDDSFASGLIEGPQYTRPVEFRGWRVPDILLSGNHAAIARWRREQALEKTRRVRPDLLPP